LARLDSIVMESPTVGLDFNYYLTDGGNERKLGFNIPTSALDNYDGGRASATTYFSTGDLAVSGYSALSGLIDDSEGNNYFIVVSPEGQDVDQSTLNSTDFEVIGIGNGFISDYSIDASVGAIPTASVTVEGFNIKVDNRISGSAARPYVTETETQYAPFAPGVTSDGTYPTGDVTASPNVVSSIPQFTIPSALDDNKIDTTGVLGTPSALRPGDIRFSMGTSGSYQGLTEMSGDGEAHLQSVSISVPLSRTTLQRLGNTFGYARVIDLPLNVQISLSVIVSELKKNNIYNTLCHTQTHDFTITLHPCSPSTGNTDTSTTKMQFLFQNARLESETFSNTLGDNQTADLTFSCQVGGSNDTVNGIQMNGSYQLFRTLPFFPLGARKSLTDAYTVD